MNAALGISLVSVMSDGRLAYSRAARHTKALLLTVFVLLVLLVPRSVEVGLNTIVLLRTVVAFQVLVIAVVCPSWIIPELAIQDLLPLDRQSVWLRLVFIP